VFCIDRGMCKRRVSYQKVILAYILKQMETVMYLLPIYFEQKVIYNTTLGRFISQSCCQKYTAYNYLCSFRINL